MVEGMLTVGKGMRALRLDKEFTLADLAKRSGVALSTLSRIETGRMTGTLESHIRIARALGVRLPELYADVDLVGPAVELRPGPSEDSFSLGKGAGFALLTQESLRKKMLPAMIYLKPGQIGRAHV